MTTIDPSTDIGKLRLRVADYSDLVFLPDAVYSQTLEDNDNNLTKCATIIATYILGILSLKTHRKLAQLEVWGGEAFKNYKDFLLLTVTNPAFMSIAPIPYSSSSTDLSAIQQFQNDWNKNYANGTQSQQLASDALNSPNDGSLYGNTNYNGWEPV